MSYKQMDNLDSCMDTVDCFAIYLTYVWEKGFRQLQVATVTLCRVPSENNCSSAVENDLRSNEISNSKVYHIFDHRCGRVQINRIEATENNAKTMAFRRMFSTAIAGSHVSVAMNGLSHFGKPT